jgi:cytochrome P450
MLLFVQHNAEVVLHQDLPGRTWRDTVARIATSPAASRFVFAALRAVRPVLQPPAGIRRFLPLPGGVVVTRDADVRDILARDDEFTIAEINAERIERVSGPFILSMDRGERYDREHAALRAAVRPDDLPHIGELTLGLARELIEVARPAGRIDVVNGYARIAAVRFVDRYLGVPAPADGEAAMAAWMRALFDNAFVADDVRARAVAAASAPAVRAHLEGLIAATRARHAGQTGTGDTVLDRLIEVEDDDDLVRRNIAGLIIGAVDTTSKAVAYAADELLRRPDALASARLAAGAGDDDGIRRHVHEALRFRPHQPIVLRYCRAGATVGGHAIRAGSIVAAATQSAMFDKRAMPRPRSFELDRPSERYLTFGGGMHECFGTAINNVTLPVLVGELLRLPDLARAPGREGRIRHDGGFPDRFVLTFGA